jgi:hypothetical protein
MGASESLSIQKRELGNKIYKKYESMVSPELTIIKMNIAIHHYTEAIRLAKTGKEKSESYKSISLCYEKMYNSKKANFEEGIFYFKLCFENLLNCYSLNKNILILANLRKLLDDIIDYIFQKSDNPISEAMKLKTILTWKHVELRSLYCIIMAKKYFILCIKDTEAERFNQALGFAYDCMEICGELKSNNIEYKFNEEVEDIEDCVNFYIYRIKTFICINQGKKIMSKAFNEDETIDMELFYDILDKFREALNINNILENKDIELEAICFSEIGCLLYTVLKNEERANELLNLSINLGMSLHPKNVHNERWYRKAYKFLEEIRQNKLKREHEENKKAREQFFDEIKPDVDKFKPYEDKGWEEFVKYVLKTHPPTAIGEFNIETELSKEDKKANKILVKVIAFYHPDKVLNTEQKKKILFEEICKVLNNFYSTMKLLNSIN